MDQDQTDRLDRLLGVSPCRVIGPTEVESCLLLPPGLKQLLCSRKEGVTEQLLQPRFLHIGLPKEEPFHLKGESALSPA